MATQGGIPRGKWGMVVTTSSAATADEIDQPSTILTGASGLRSVHNGRTPRGLWILIPTLTLTLTLTLILTRTLTPILILILTLTLTLTLTLILTLTLTRLF